MTAKDLMDVLVPSPDASPAAIARWRWFQGMSTTVLILSTVCLYFITAKASEVDDLKVAVYVPAMEQMHKRYCLSQNEETRALLRRQVNKMQLQYKHTTGDMYPLENCRDIQERSQ